MIWALTNELIETSLLLPGKHPLPGAMTDLRLRNSPRDGHLAFTLCLSFCLVTYNFTSPFVRRCSFLWMFSITTSASDSTRTSRWSSMNPEVRTAFRPRLPREEVGSRCFACSLLFPVPYKLTVLFHCDLCEDPGRQTRLELTTDRTWRPCCLEFQRWEEMGPVVCSRWLLFKFDWKVWS